MAAPFSQSEIQAINEYPNYVIGSGNGGSCSGSTTLTGSDNEEKAWNFFRQASLNDVQTAAVIGNLMDESHLDPTIMQIGGDSQNPADAGSEGWGIAQWTPGAKVIDIASGLKITSPIYELSTQLNIVLAEMKGQAPTGYQNLFSQLQQYNKLADAVSFFQVNFEGGVAGQRQQFAQDALQKFGSGTAPSSTSSSGGCGSSLSPDCQSASGVAKIICDAKKYDPVSYSETTDAGHQGGAAWHATCPTIGPSCILDCSGLVNIAVYDVYGADLQENTYSEASDTSNWQHIPFSQVQPGDLIQPNPGHVEIIDHIQGDTIQTFGAHTSQVPQPDQVGPASYPVGDSSYLFLHYIGTGSSS